MNLYLLSIYAAKSAIVLIYLVAFYRLIGKRDLGQFNVYDLVTVIALSNAVQNAMTAGRGELSVGLSAAFTLLAVGYLLSRLYVRHPISQRLAFGSPVLLISNGAVLTERLRREHVSEEELHATIRQHGLNSEAEVAIAVLEVDGSISVVPKQEGVSVDRALD